jgi:hypothetical protein
VTSDHTSLTPLRNTDPYAIRGESGTPFRLADLALSIYATEIAGVVAGLPIFSSSTR